MKLFKVILLVAGLVCYGAGAWGMAGEFSQENIQTEMQTDKEKDQLWQAIKNAYKEDEKEKIPLLLIEKGANTQAVYEEGSYLHLALEKGLTQVAKKLIEEKKVDLYAVDRTKENALHKAAKKNNIEIVKLLTQQDDSTDFVNAQGNITFTPLVYGVSSALRNRGDEVLAYLLTLKNIDKSIKVGGNNKTAWDIANDEIKNKFPQLNPDYKASAQDFTFSPPPDQGTGSSFTFGDSSPIEGAEAKKETEEEQDSLNKELEKAVRYNNYEKVIELLDQGADPKYRGLGPRALLNAVKNKKTDVALQLINKKVGLEQIEQNNLTPLYYAIDYRNLELAEALLKAGAKIVVKRETIGVNNVSSRRLMEDAIDTMDMKYVDLILKYEPQALETVNRQSLFIFSQFNEKAKGSPFVKEISERLDAVESNKSVGLLAEMLSKLSRALTALKTALGSLVPGA